jgi:hypothetical protein
MMDDEVEAVARAFYDVSGYDEPWDQAPVLIRANMRQDALTAIEALKDYRGDHLIDDFLVALKCDPASELRRRYH